MTHAPPAPVCDFRDCAVAASLKQFFLFETAIRCGWEHHRYPLHTDVLSRGRPLKADATTVMSKGRVLTEFWQFLRQEKKYWLVPIVIVFILFGLLIVFSQSSAVAPFIYTLF